MIDSIIEIGKITGAVGIKGYLKVNIYLTKVNLISKLGPVLLENKSQVVKINFIREQKGKAIISMQNVDNRNKAELLKDKKLFIFSSKLPKLKKNEYYLRDLLNLSVVNTDGKKIGIVKQIKNFGSCDLMEVYTNNNKYFFLPINKENVKKIDLNNKKIIVEPIKGIIS